MVTKTEIITGLSENEAKKRLDLYGYNELEVTKKKGLLYFLWQLIKEPMIELLIITGVLYLFLGDKLEAIALLSSIVFIVLITLYQDKRSENSLQLLRELANPKATVIRGGTEKVIPSREIVVGDIIRIAEGDKVSADARVILAANLSLNESILTGESLPVSKVENGENDESRIFAGTLVVCGHGLAEVFDTANDTAIGKIGSSLNDLSIEKTFLQKEISMLIKTVAFIGIGLCLLLFVAYGLTRGNWTEGFLAGLTLAMGILPEEFPVVLVLFLTMGAWRLAKKQVLTSRAATIETLGSVTTLCVDKTGTLTQNSMDIEAVFDGGTISVKEKSTELDRILEFGILASQQKPFDPMENAFFSLRDKLYGNISKIYKGKRIVKEFPLEKDSLSVVHLWEDSNGLTAAAKGAPEAILKLCKMKSSESGKYLSKIEEMTKVGYRVLGVACSTVSSDKLPEKREELKYELLGFVCLSDPTRPGVEKSIEECKRAGVRVIMITGDYPTTALSIANKIGLETKAGVINGSELEKMSDDELLVKVNSVNVFSRVRPEQKLIIVNALKKMGEVVAMTGDGVNDAPALKSAHIGIAMGKRGTDVAREAAALVLLDDDFSSIVHGIRMGRRIYDNLQKAVKYLLTVHVPIAGLSLLPVIFKWPLVMLPLHIVFMELVIDPSCTIIFEAEPEESDIMERKPRDIEEKIFNWKLFVSSLAKGLFILLILALSYRYVLMQGWSAEKARTFVFSALVVSNISLILATRSGKQLAIKRLFAKRNMTILFVSIFTLGILALTIFVGPIRNVFKFEYLQIGEVGSIAILGFLPLFAYDFLKLTRKLINF